MHMGPKFRREKKNAWLCANREKVKGECKKIYDFVMSHINVA